MSVDCGSDAHAHVRACPLNPRPNDIYGSVAEFHQHHNARKRRGVILYMGSDAVAVEDRIFVATALREHLRDIGFGDILK